MPTLLFELAVLLASVLLLEEYRRMPMPLYEQLLLASALLLEYFTRMP
ncbi:MAG: hypothetical protein C5S49_04075 [Candidatus Methanogaster sp.]|nr:MAG: hypothetical protein C5S49_04075 [ANME-2 cluster archaeon]